MNALGEKVTDDLGEALSGGPQDCAVPLAVDHAQVSALVAEVTQYVDASEASRDVDGALAVLFRERAIHFNAEPNLKFEFLDIPYP